MMKYCRKNLTYAKEYMATLKEGCGAYVFCLIPFLLAEATLTAKENGQPKLKREQVMEIVKNKVQ